MKKTKKMKLIKNLLLAIAFVLIHSGTMAQTNESYYKAVVTEMYIRSDAESSWELYQKNGTTNITIVVEDDFISVQAQKPTIYRIFKNNTEEINTDKLVGIRYLGKDLKTDEYCTLDIVKSKSSETYLISIIKKNMNFRYFIDRN
jgi:hypothetical protein